MDSIKLDSQSRWLTVSKGHVLSVFDLKSKETFNLVPETKKPAQEEPKKKKRKKGKTVDLKQLDVVLPIVRFFDYWGPHHIVSGGDDKTIRVWDLNTKALIHSHVLNKRIEQGIVIDDKLLVADKPGDVFRFGLPDLSSEKCVMGHFGLITGLKCVDENTIISSDVDGKIRVSGYPLLANIRRFCLGHTTSVSCVTLAKLTKGLECVVSGGGMQELKAWNFNEGRCLGSLVVDIDDLAIDMSAHAPNRSNSEVEMIMRAKYNASQKNKAKKAEHNKKNEDNEKKDEEEEDEKNDNGQSQPKTGFNPYVSLVEYDEKSQTLAVVCNPCSGVLLYDIMTDGEGVSFVKRKSLKTTSRPIAVSFDSSSNLICLLDDTTKPLRTFAPSGEEVQTYDWTIASLNDNGGTCVMSNAEDYERRRHSRLHRESEYKAKADRNRAKVAAHNAKVQAEKEGGDCKVDDSDE